MDHHITFRSILNDAPAERPTLPVPAPAPPTTARILSNRLAQLSADLREGRITVPATAAALAALAAMVGA